MSPRRFVLAGLFAALTGVGAIIGIPTPGGVPLTLQLVFVFLAGAVLGPRYGALSQIVYLLLGATGVPVFAGPAGGPHHLLGPTGGFLLAFPVAAALVGLLLRRGRATPVRGVAASLAGLLPVYCLGAWRLAAFMPGEAVSRGIIPFIVPDLVKVLLAGTCYPRLVAVRGGNNGRRVVDPSRE